MKPLIQSTVRRTQAQTLDQIPEINIRAPVIALVTGCLRTRRTASEGGRGIGGIGRRDCSITVEERYLPYLQ